MSFLRRRSTWVASCILLLQLAAFAAAAATAAVCCRRAMTKGPVMDCCKGKSHSCPLMKKQQAPTEADSSMKSCPGKDDGVASMLFGARGMLGFARIASIAASRAIPLVADAHRGPSSRPVAVETPPPRA
jgi:hypothetical protein